MKKRHPRGKIRYRSPRFKDEETIRLKWKSDWNGHLTTAYNVGYVHLEDYPTSDKLINWEKRAQAYRANRKLERDLIWPVHISASRNIIPKGRKYELIIDYPLKRPFTKIITGPKDLQQIVDIIVESYRKIYEIERKTSKLKEETIKSRTKGASRIINRAETDGKYGILGHVLGDLDMHSIYVGGGKIYVGVDS